MAVPGDAQGQVSATAASGPGDTGAGADGRARFAFWLDVDNTLIDNDGAKVALARAIEALVGAERAEAFWTLYEAVRHELEVVDFPETLRRFAARFPRSPGYPELAALVLGFDYLPFRYPGALAAIDHLATLGTVAILSDGDPVFQPAKIARAGLARAVEDRVFLAIHKQQHLDELTALYPAERFVLVDDKPDILAAAKRHLGERLVTINVKQGKYAHGSPPVDPPPDIVLPGIADLAHLPATRLEC